MSQGQEQEPGQGHTPAYAATKCAVCGSNVGLLWVRGHSCLVETRIEEHDGRYVVTPHRCPGLTTAAELPARQRPLPGAPPPGPRRRQPHQRKQPLHRRAR